MIMNNDQPIAFFITFTVYGTFLQGDARWWRSRTNGTQPPQWAVFIDRPVWSVGGDWKCINTEDDLEQVILYVSEAQDRMEHK